MPGGIGAVVSKVKNTLGSFGKDKPSAAQGCASSDESAKAKKPKPWKLKVTVKSQKDFWPKTAVTVSLKMQEGDAGDKGGSLNMTAKTSSPLAFDGEGNHKYEITATADNWELVAKQDVSLADGDNKQVELELKPLPWIALKVVDEKDKAVPKVAMKLTLPGNVKREVETTEEALRIEGLKTGGNCAIDEMSFEKEVWEIVEVKSS